MECLEFKFDLPRCLIETGSESRLPTPNDKKLISEITIKKLKKLVINFNTEPQLLSWVDTFTLFTECINLEHLEVKRQLKFRTLASKTRDLFKKLPDS